MKYFSEAMSMFLGSTNSVASLVIYAAIVILFVMGLVRCVFPVVRTRGRIRSAIRTIRAGGENKYAWQEDGFLGKGVLFAHWSDYLNNLFFADGRYHNASNVEDYINEETVIYGPGRISFAEALPGLLTSLGFLGTLIGLAAGLSGFNMSDSAAVQSSIVTLIPGMRYAFMTSIFGVVASVLFTLITRMVYGSTEHTLSMFYSAMSRHAGVLSVDPMTQIAIYQQEQTALIKTMTKDLNGQFTENMTQAIQKAVEPLNETMQGFVNGITREQARLVDVVLARFVDRLNEAMGGSFRRFGEVLDETAALQRENSQSVKASLSGAADLFNDLVDMRRIVQDLLGGTSDYVKGLNAARQESEEAYMRVNATVEQMALVSRQETEYLKSISEMQAQLARSSEDMTAAMNRFADHFTAEGDATAAGMTHAADELRDAAQKLAQVHREAAHSISEELNATLDSYRDYVNQFTQRVDYLSSGIAGSLDRMPAAVKEANDRLLDQVDALTDAVERAQRSLNDAANRMYRR